MGTIGAKGIETRSNDIMEIWRYLGIEAARDVIMSEIKKVMGAYGMTIDVRHTMLLADCMTSKVCRPHFTPLPCPSDFVRWHCGAKCSGQTQLSQV